MPDGYGIPPAGARPPNDEELKEAVEENITFDPWIDASQINVNVEHGKVILEGEVDSVIEKRSAADDAWDTVGVIDVENRLAIKRQGSTE
ncbi:MAG: BON domain-containing protein [bacterium]|nr:BON domain-containing protein [bacterium]